MADVTFLIGAADYAVAHDDAATLARDLSEHFIPAAAPGRELAGALRLSIAIWLNLAGAAREDVIDLDSTEIAVLAAVLDEHHQRRDDGRHVADELHAALSRYLHSA